VSRSHLTCLLTSLAVLAFFAWRFDFVCDDAYIAFRYSKNFAEGLGLRYNLGVEPPVEGYTQFGWVLWGALIERLGLELPLWSRVTTSIAGALLLTLTVRLAHARFGLAAAWAAGLFLAALPTFATWMTGGLETMAFSLAIFLAFERLCADPDRPRALQASLAFAAGTLLRADGVYFLGAILAGALLWSFRWSFQPPRPALRRAALVAAAVLASVTAAHFAFRYAYHGDWLPNTVRAKVGMSAMTLERGSLYVLSYWMVMPGTLVALLVGGGFALAGSSGLARFSLWIASLAFLYGVLVGGDFMCMGRFFLPGAPFLALLLAHATSRLQERVSLAAAGVFAGLVTLASVPLAFDRYLVPESLRARADFRWSSNRYIDEYDHWRGMKTRAEGWVALGQALRQHTKPGDSLVRGAIGAVGYYSDLFLYDQYGLVNRAVAANPPPPARRSTPGHDRYVQPEFFADQHPTFERAYLIRADSRPRRTDAYEADVLPVADEDGGVSEWSLVLVRW
jgi:hypothetical protein